MVKKLLTIVLILVAGAASALTPAQRAAILGGPPTYTSPCVTLFPAAQQAQGATPPQSTGSCPAVGSAGLAYDNVSSLASLNTGIQLTNTGNSSPLLLPNPVTGPWTLVITGLVNDADDPFYSSNTAGFQSWLTSCATAKNCTGGGDRYLWISSRHTSASTPSQNNELLLSGKTGGGVTNLWPGLTTGGAPHTGIQLTPGTTYCVALSENASNILTIYAYDTTGAPAPGSPAVAYTSNYVATTTGFLSTGSGARSQGAVGSLFKLVGTAYTTNSGGAGSIVNEYGALGPFANLMMIWGAASNNFATILSQYCQGLIDPYTFATNGAYYGGALQNLYRLNDPPSGGYADSVANSSAATTLTGGVTPITGSPIQAPPCVTLNEAGPNDVFSVSPASGTPTVGMIYVSGTVNWAQCGFAGGGVDAAIYQGGALVSPWVNAPAGAGVFHIAVPNIPANSATSGNTTPYTLAARLHRSRAYVYMGRYPVYVGLKIGLIGQSQLNTIFNPTYGGTYNIHSCVVPTSGTAYPGGPAPYTVLNMPLNDQTAGAPILASNYGGGVVTLMGVDPGNTCNGNSGANNVLTGQNVTDDATEIMNTLYSLSGGMPVQLVNFSKSGQASDAFAFGYYPQAAQTLQFSSGKWSATLITNQNIPSATEVTGFAFTIKHGSVVVTDGNSNIIVTDSQTSPFDYNTQCTYGFTTNFTNIYVSSTGVLTLTLPVSPAIALTSGNTISVAGATGANASAVNITTSATTVSGQTVSYNVGTGLTFTLPLTATLTTTAPQSGMTCVNVTNLAAGINVLALSGVPMGETVASVSGQFVTLAMNTTGPSAQSGYVGVNFTNYGPLTGPNGAYGAVNYTLNSGGPNINVTVVAQPQPQALLATFTTLQDTQAGAYNQQIPYVGYDVFGDGVSTASGYVTAMANRVGGPLTAMIIGQCSANAGEVANTSPATTSGVLSQTAKWDYILGTRFAGFWWWSTQTALMMPDYQRDDGGISSANVGGCSYFQQYYSGLIPGHTPPTTLGPIYYGGDYWDYAVYCSSVLATSCIGHGGAGQHGGQLAGHRYAYNLWQIINGTAAQNLAAGAPVAVRTASLSGCANTGNTEGGSNITTGNYTWLRCTFAIPTMGPVAGASLATCGPTLSGASGGGGYAQPIFGSGSAYVATGYCQSTTAGGAPVKGFRIGKTQTTMSNDLSVDESSGGGSGGPLWTVQPQQLFSCIIANTTPPPNKGYVDCQNLSGGAWTWAAGQTLYISYLAEGPGELGGTVPAFTVTAGGGYSSGAHTITATGGGCSPEPIISVMVSNGAIQPPPASFVTNIGKGCTSAPSFSVSGLGGSGGGITPTWYNTAYDMNDVGEMLYTNDATPMGATGYDAPGFPVQRSVILTTVN